MVRVTWTEEAVKTKETISNRYFVVTKCHVLIVELSQQNFE